jgi:hypothetical protein
MGFNLLNKFTICLDNCNSTQVARQCRYLGSHNKPKALVRPGHKLTGPKKEEGEEDDDDDDDDEEEEEEEEEGKCRSRKTNCSIVRENNVPPFIFPSNCSNKYIPSCKSCFYVLNISKKKYKSAYKRKSCN